MFCQSEMTKTQLEEATIKQRMLCFFEQTHHLFFFLQKCIVSIFFTPCLLGDLQIPISKISVDLIGGYIFVLFYNYLPASISVDMSNVHMYRETSLIRDREFLVTFNSMDSSMTAFPVIGMILIRIMYDSNYRHPFIFIIYTLHSNEVHRDFVYKKI